MPFGLPQVARLMETAQSVPVSDPTDDRIVQFITQPASYNTDEDCYKRR